MKTLHFTATASNDLDAILDYIARDRPHTAVHVVKKIRNKCELLVDHPEMDKPIPSLEPPFAVFPSSDG